VIAEYRKCSRTEGLMRRAERRQNPARGVLVGCGFIAEGHLDGYAHIDELQIQTVVEPNSKRRERATVLLPEAQIVTSLDEVDLGAHDFVDICAPPTTHLEYALRSLAAGLPTLCEKPLVLDLAELHALVDAEQRSRGFVYPCHNYLFAPSMRRLLDLLPRLRATDQPVTRGHFRTLRRGHAQGVPEWYPDWRRDPQIGGGGILQDHGPHSIYIAMRAVGTPVVAVRCLTIRPMDGPFRMTEEIAKLDLCFECGSIVTIELDWGNESRQSAYLFDGPWGYLRLIDDRLVGHASDVVIREDIESNFNDPRHGAWFEAVLRHFRASWDNRALADALRSEAWEVVRIIAAAYASSDAGGILVGRERWSESLVTAHEVVAE